MLIDLDAGLGHVAGLDSSFPASSFGGALLASSHVAACDAALPAQLRLSFDDVMLDLMPSSGDAILLTSSFDHSSPAHVPSDDDDARDFVSPAHVPSDVDDARDSVVFDLCDSSLREFEPPSDVSCETAVSSGSSSSDAEQDFESDRETLSSPPSPPSLSSSLPQVVPPGPFSSIDFDRETGVVTFEVDRQPWTPQSHFSRAQLSQLLQFLKQFPSDTDVPHFMSPWSASSLEHVKHAPMTGLVVAFCATKKESRRDFHFGGSGSQCTRSPYRWMSSSEPQRAPSAKPDWVSCPSRLTLRKGVTDAPPPPLHRRVYRYTGDDDEVRKLKIVMYTEYSRKSLSTRKRTQ